MKVVLDTNVVVSGVFFGGTPGRVLAAWSAGKFTLVLSPAILDEYRRVGDDLGHRYPALSSAFEPVLTLIAMNAIIVDAPGLDKPVSADADDDMFLAAALAAQASIIVSGDRDLLEVSGWRDIERGSTTPVARCLRYDLFVCCAMARCGLRRRRTWERARRGGMCLAATASESVRPSYRCPPRWWMACARGFWWSSAVPMTR